MRPSPLFCPACCISGAVAIFHPLLPIFSPECVYLCTVAWKLLRANIPSKMILCFRKKMNPAFTREKNTVADTVGHQRTLCVCVCVFARPALLHLYVLLLFVCSLNEICFLQRLLPLEQGQPAALNEGMATISNHFSNFF